MAGAPLLENKPHVQLTLVHAQTSSRIALNSVLSQDSRTILLH